MKILKLTFLILIINTGQANFNFSEAQVLDFKIKYRFSQPDPWGNDFWKYQNQDDSYWQTAKTFNELAIAVKQQKPKEVFIRFKVKHTPETLNNFYFIMRHSGPIEVFVNGIKNRGTNKSAVKSYDMLINPRRPEQLGLNIYAIHFTQTELNEEYLEIEPKISKWVTTDDGTYIPKSIMPTLLRDAQICVGGDKAYYMTATTGDSTFLLPNKNYWLQSPGIQVFRSIDLKNWKSLGFVWTFDKDGTWNKEAGTFSSRGPARAIFAPEIQFYRGKYWINYSVNNVVAKRAFGIGLLYADKPEGPYTEIRPEKPLVNGYDSNFFMDDNDTPYMLNHGGEIAKMKADLSGFEEPFRHLAAANYPNVGYEGVNMFKYQNTYYLTSADYNVHKDGTVSYDCMIASSKNIYGPYSNRYCAIKWGGHNSLFKGMDGKVYATVWCYPDGSNNWQKLSIVELKLNKQGLFQIEKP